MQPEMQLHRLEHLFHQILNIGSNKGQLYKHSNEGRRRTRNVKMAKPQVQRAHAKNVLLAFQL
jgi:hypothetical protein